MDNDLESKLREYWSDLAPNDSFRNELRSRILLQSKNEKIKKETSMFNLSASKLLMPLGGAALALTLLVVVWAGANNLPEERVASVAQREGFGKLPAPSERGAAPDAMVARGQADATRSFGMGGMVDPAPGSSPERLIYPGDEYIPPVIEYNLIAELPEAPAEQYVYRDEPTKIDTGALQSLSKSINLGLLQRIDQSDLRYLTVYLPSEEMYLGLESYGGYRLWREDRRYYSETEVGNNLSDEEIKSIAGSFLDRYGISTEGFGDAVVQKPDMGIRPLPVDIQDSGMRSSGTADAMVMPRPTSVGLSYSSQIDGRDIVSWGGHPESALYINVDTVEKRVLEASYQWNQNKQRSLYQTESEEAILEQAGKGGLNPLGGYGHGVREGVERPKIIVNLTEAKLAYMRYLHYEGEDRVYYVPVYVFSGSYTDAEGVEQQYSSVVPAIKSSLFENHNTVSPAEQPLKQDVPDSSLWR